MPYTAVEIAKLIGGTVIGDGSTTLTGIAPAISARPGDLTFAENDQYFARAEQSAASAVLVDAEFESRNKALIKVPNARIGFARAMSIFFPEQPFAAGIHVTAIVDPSAKIASSAHVGPYCVIGANARIGERVVLQGMAQVGNDCEIGDATCIFPNVTLYARTQVGRN